MNIGKNGVKGTVGIPGTGISYTESITSKKTKHNVSNKNISKTSANEEKVISESSSVTTSGLTSNKKLKLWASGFIGFFFFFLFVVSVILLIVALSIQETVVVVFLSVLAVFNFICFANHRKAKKQMKLLENRITNC